MENFFKKMIIILIAILILFFSFYLFKLQAMRKENSSLLEILQRNKEEIVSLEGKYEEISLLLKEKEQEIEEKNKNFFNIFQEVSDWKIQWNYMKMEVTAYAPFDNVSGICSDGNPSSTSTGTYPSWGTVAVNPKIIPYGSILYIEGYGWGRAEDTGSAIRTRTDLIDVYFDTHKAACSWGRRKGINVYWFTPPH